MRGDLYRLKAPRGVRGHEQAGEVAAGRAASVDQVMEEKAHRAELADLLAEMRSENEPATQEEDAWVRKALGL